MLAWPQGIEVAKKVQGLRAGAKDLWLSGLSLDGLLVRACDISRKG